MRLYDTLIFYDNITYKRIRTTHRGNKQLPRKLNPVSTILILTLFNSFKRFHTPFIFRLSIVICSHIIVYSIPIF